MKQLLLFHFLLIKRCFGKISFILLMFGMVLLCFVLKEHISDESGYQIRIGVYYDEQNKIADRIFHAVCNKYRTTTFEKCDDLEEMKEKIIQGTYDSGFKFSDHFDERFQRESFEGIITSYVSPSSTTYLMAKEYLFSEVFYEHAFSLMIRYIRSDDVFKHLDLSTIETELRPIYEDYYFSDKTFAFEYITPENTHLKTDRFFTSLTMTSVKGIIALFILFAAIIGTLNIYKDDSNKVFYAFHYPFKALSKMTEIYTTTLIASLFGMIAIQLCGISDGWQIELVRLLFYTLICTLYFFVFFRIAKNQYVFAAIIPLLVLGSIIFCPIFLDMTEILPFPFFQKLGWLFAPKYYFIL